MLALVVLMAAWHLAFQRAGISEEAPRRVLVHLVGLAVLWFFLAGADPTYFSLLLILYPQTFRYLRLSYAIPAAIALTVAVVWREVLLSGRPLSENGTAVASGVLSVLFGVLFATWISPSGSAPTWS